MPLLELLDKFIKLKVSLQAIAGFFRTQKIFFLKEFYYFTVNADGNISSKMINPTYTLQNYENKL